MQLFQLSRIRDVLFSGSGPCADPRWTNLQRPIYFRIVYFRLFVTGRGRNWRDSSGREHTLKPKTTINPRVLLREWFLIQPGNGSPCLALKIPARMSRTCHCMRHYIMSMSQTGTKPAWPGAPTCVTTTGLDISGEAGAPPTCGESQALQPCGPASRECLLPTLFLSHGRHQTHPLPNTTFPFLPPPRLRVPVVPPVNKHILLQGI